MSTQNSEEEILSVMRSVDYVAVSTLAGSKIRTWMMHFSNDKGFNIYLATMKGDPKTVQITQETSVSLLILSEKREGDSKKIAVTGRAVRVTDENEKQRAFEGLAEKSPVVKQLRDSENLGILDCVKVVPDIIKYRGFREIIQGVPPTVLKFPRARTEFDKLCYLKQKLKNYFIEVRAPFFTASIVPILLGTAIAWTITGSMSWYYFLLTLLGGVFLHAGTNVINDYFDYKSGNDEINKEFVRPFSGGSRMIQLGLLTPSEVFYEAFIFFALGSLIGLYLTWTRGPIVLILGLIGVFSGFFYTGPPFNLARLGIGETFVGLNFGVLMTLGSFYVQTQFLSWEPVVAAIPVSLLIAAVLWINEFPDYHADRDVGKNTMVVRLGRRSATLGFTMILVATYLSLIMGVVMGVLPPATLIGTASLPLSITAIRYAWAKYFKPFELVPANASTILCHLATGLLIALGYIFDKLKFPVIGYTLILVGVFGVLIIYINKNIEKQKNIFLDLIP